MTNPTICLLALLSAVFVSFAGCGHRVRKDTNAGPSTLDRSQLLGDTAPVRDPSIAFEHGRYIVYSTDPTAREHVPGYLPVRCSADRRTWSRCGYVFSALPGWIRAALPQVRNLWAPDIAYFAGEYHLYYCASSLGSQDSVIGLATNATLDPSDPHYQWVDRGLVLASKQGDDFNAIDPNILVTNAKGIWLTYGSSWSGVKQRRVDPSTGMLMSTTASKRYNLAATARNSQEVVEGASILRHGSFYYLFLSKGLCCESDLQRDDYREVVGRSRRPWGPFVDTKGDKLSSGGGTVLVHGDERQAAPGGGSAYYDPATSEDILVFHALERANHGRPTMVIKTITWRDGWPTVG